MGQDQGPLSPDEQAAYQAGITVAAGGTPPSNVDLSTAVNQGLFNAGFNAGASGGPASGTLGVLSTLGFPVSPAPSTTPGMLPTTTNSLAAWLQANQQTVLLIGGGLFGLVLLTSMMGGRR